MTSTDQVLQKSLLTYFNIYRILLVSSLLGLSYLLNDQAIDIDFNNSFYRSSVYIYAGVIFFSFIASSLFKFSQLNTLSILLADALMLTVIMKVGGGPASGLGNLIIVSIAAGSVLLRFNYAILLAAIASSAVVYSEIFGAFADIESSEDYVQAALIGVACFATTFIMQLIVAKVQTSERLAAERQSYILDLTQLNELIVQRMRTGIVVASPTGEIRTLNEAASLLITNQKQPATNSTQLPSEIFERLKQWQQNPQVRSSVFRVHASMPDVQANFTALQDKGNTDVLIFLEDTALATQQAQQLKLASLGRLTAGIAHEIRNPLGAISHASQLLNESENLDDADRRLLQIVQTHSVRMNNIIENVLQLSRRRKAQPELINLNHWLKSIANEIQESMDADANISILVDEKIQARIDVTQMAQVIHNLAQNGLRYSKQNNGIATLTLKATIGNANQQPVLDIIDDGVGISEDLFDHVFEPFYTTEASGTGLGLYISKELCEANQARLELVKVEKGCCFRITFSHPMRIASQQNK